tara:strand:+ start:1077 stop:2045 length:969 start_codon:yes stop_codon:yes gene_type:complete
MRIAKKALAVILLINVAGCQLLPEDAQLKSYRVLVQQGNVIDESKVDALKINMTKEQVTFLLGEPVVNNIFNKDRWDYVYYRKRDPEETKLNMISIFFDGEKVISMKRITKNDEGLFEINENKKVSQPEFLNDEETIAINEKIFNEIDLEGVKNNELDKEDENSDGQNKQKNKSEAKEHIKEIENKKNKQEVIKYEETKVTRKNDFEIVTEFIEAWANAWEQKDVEKYFSYYASDYTSSYYDDHNLWKEDRKKRILNKSKINISISNISINFDIEKEEKAIITFDQNYVSDNYKDLVTKKITLIKKLNNWVIISEELIDGKY